MQDAEFWRVYRAVCAADFDSNVFTGVADFLCVCMKFRTWGRFQKENMKYIIAIIRPEKLEAVQNALDEKEVHLQTVSNVHGCGSQRGYTEAFRGAKVPVRLIQKVKLEIAVNDDFAARTVDAITKAAYSGKIADGKIFVLPLEDCIRIRTNEKGNVAIGP